jgi:hypothetical protein
VYSLNYCIYYITAGNPHKQNSRFCKEIREDNFRFWWRRIHEDASQGMYMSKTAQKGVKGSPGTLTIRFYHMKSGHWNHLALPYLESLFNFHLGDSNVDLKNGVITM